MSAPSQPPVYKGEPLDAERGPGLGCFWIQIGLLTFFLVFTPLTVTWGWDPFISGALLIFTLILLLFAGQTVIFLLRLVAADRRSRRAPLATNARPTVGQLEDREVSDVNDGTDSQAESQAESQADGKGYSEADGKGYSGPRTAAKSAAESDAGAEHDGVPREAPPNG